MGLSQIRRRIERLEARQHADPLAGLREFHYLWVEALPDNTPVPSGSRIKREFSCSGSIPDWGRTGLTFRYGTVREQVVTDVAEVVPGKVASQASETAPVEAATKVDEIAPVEAAEVTAKDARKNGDRGRRRRRASGRPPGDSA